MSKPYFFFRCTFLEKNWKDNIFGGKWLFKCKFMRNEPCDESICKFMNGKRIKDTPKKEKSGIVVIDQGLVQTITRDSNDYEKEVIIK